MTHTRRPSTAKSEFGTTADNPAERETKTYSAAFDFAEFGCEPDNKDYSLAFSYNNIEYWMPLELELELELDEIEKRFGEIAKKAFARRVSAAGSFADQLARMRLKERRDALKKHYVSRQPWAVFRGSDPTPEAFLEWLNANFRDRRAIGLLYGDMEHLDHEAFLKLKNWRASKDPEILAAVARFDLPTKQEAYDPATAVKEAPTSRQVRDAFLLGDPDAPVLERKHLRAKYHAPRR